MNFINFSFLTGLILSTIPIIIHLLNKYKKNIVEYSTLEYIKKINQRQLKRIKLKKILLLIIRTLIILLITLAFARPLIKTKNTSFSFTNNLSQSKLSYAIIIDNSITSKAYTQNGKIINISKNIASKIINNPKNNGVFYIISIDNLTSNLKLQKTDNKIILNELLNSIETTDLIFEWKNVINFISKNLTKTLLPLKQIFIITATDQSNLEKKDITTFRKNFQETQLTIIKPFKKNINNVDIDTVIIENPQISQSGTIPVKAIIKNYSNENFSDLNIDIFIDKKRRYQTITNLNANEKKIVKFNLEIKEKGLHKCFVSIPDDDFIDDNKYYFNVSIPDNFKILILYDSANTNFQLQKAISPIDSNNLFITTIKSINNISDLIFEKYNTIILNQLTTFPPYLLNSLKNYLKNGNKFIVIPNITSNIINLNKTFFNFFNINAQIEQIENLSNNQYYSISQLINKNITHDIDNKIYWQNTKILKRLDLFTPDKNITINHILYNDNKPFLLSFKTNTSEILFFTTNFEEYASNLIYQPIIVPFMQNLIQYAIQNNSQKLLENRDIMYKNIFFKNDFPQTDSIKNENTTINFAKIDNFKLIPANYIIYSDNQKRGLSVNLARNISNLNYNNKIFDDFIEIEKIDDINNKLNANIFSLEISIYLLYLVFLLLIIESILARE